MKKKRVELPQAGHTMTWSIISHNEPADHITWILEIKEANGNGMDDKKTQQKSGVYIYIYTYV
jgi:hypothetical protein